MKKNPPRFKKGQALKPMWPMRLNKYVAKCGIASRRNAAEIVKKGQVIVNGEVEKNPAREIHQKDVVTFQGKKVKPESRLVYILLNKPKNVITTTDDEKNRKTVIDLVSHRISERIYPVGRLDRATTGLLLMTNDGALAQKLAHPSHQIKKVYHVILDRDVTKADMNKIIDGVELEDGKADVDVISYIEGKKRNEVGLELHSGKNRIIRRIFEHLGYTVEKLDRTYYAGLTKKDIPRGRFRRLTPEEIRMLKHFV